MHEEEKVTSISKGRKKVLTLDEIKARAGLIYKNGQSNPVSEPFDMASGKMVANKGDEVGRKRS